MNIGLKVGKVIKIFVVPHFVGWAVFPVAANNETIFTKSPVSCLFYSETEAVCFGYCSSDPGKEKAHQRN